MKILFLSGHLPSPDARQAGQKVSYYVCRHFAQRHSVRLLSFATAGELESCGSGDLEIFATREVVPITAGKRLLGVALAPGLPVAVATRLKHSFRHAIRSVLRNDRHDVVLFDNMPMWQYASDITSGTRRVGIVQDVLSQLWTRKAEYGRGLGALGARVEARRLRHWEKKTLAKLDLVCPLSGKDSQLLSELAKDVPQYVLQPWFSRPADTRLSSATREDNSIVFTGAFDRHENVDAAEFALNDILPRVASVVPQYRFHLVGGACDRLPRYVLREGRARVGGFVPDLAAFLSRMQIALLPLRLGAGIKIKVLEAMAAGLAVITTPVGAEGIPGQEGVHFLLGRTAEELARQVIALLRNPSFRARLGEKAQELIRANYDFDRSAGEFEWVLEQLLSQTQPRASLAGRLPTQDETGLAAPRRQQVPGD